MTLAGWPTSPRLVGLSVRPHLNWSPALLCVPRHMVEEIKKYINYCNYGVEVVIVDTFMCLVDR